MKRKLQGGGAAPSLKKIRPSEPEYHLTPSVKDEDGVIVWPAPLNQIEKARATILECAEKNGRTLIVPDKDADGLTSGVILYRTLVLLGLAPEKLSFHLLQKGENVHSESERELMQAQNPLYIFVLDQGSRSAPALIDAQHVGVVIDHHFASLADHPENAYFVNACHSPPVATSALLTYEICKELHDDVEVQCAWLCAIGTMGDLGNTIKWEPPFPDMRATFKQHSKKAITDAISLLNAPRRTATFDVSSALDALMKSSTPKELLMDKRLLAARAEIAAEVERCTHTAPKFSVDGRIAVFRISSQAQIHPLIATRWASHLSSAKLEIVLVANTGHLPDKVNFSCRIARTARSKEPPVDIIAALKAVAEAHPSGTLKERMGENFARGHVQASGGIVGATEFEELMSVLRVGEKPEKPDGESPKKAKGITTTQKNTLANYFGKGKDG